MLVNTPKQLSMWMINNISYVRGDEDQWFLNSPQETYNQKIGQCYDQSWFAYNYLVKLGYKTKIYYWVAYDPISLDGTTHMFVTYENNNKLFYFENAWTNNAGIHGGFNDINDIVKYTKTLISNEPDFNKFSKLYFIRIHPSDIYNGMTFSEFQSIAQRKLKI